jgi:hypothetical protein
MPSFAPIRFATIASLAFTASLLAQSPGASQTTPPASAQPQSTLPATPVTITDTTPPPPLTPSQLPPKRARITYADGTLSISADNASLNQILREISSNTGMKITGGVKDERVFGEYGPAATEQILSALLDGTGSNMILVHGDGAAPAELILTPRQGGPTPPNPNAAAFNDKNDKSDQQESAPIRASQPSPPEPAQSTPSPAANSGTPPATSPADTSQQQSPNGVKTPQQIYEELQRLRTQQQPQPQPQTKPQQ